MGEVVLETHPTVVEPKQPSPYRPLLLQCGPETHSSESSRCWLFKRLRTWYVCWPDHTNPSYTVILWTLFSCIFYIADMTADLSVAYEYYDSHDYIWFSLLFIFSFLPMIIAVLFEICYKKRVWYEAYPVGIFYWSFMTIQEYFALPKNEEIRTSRDARMYILQLRKFQECNRERNKVGDVDIYFGAMPQLILQSYIAAEVAIETGVYTVTWNSWISLVLSSLSLLRYEPTARESKKGIIIDIETVLEPAVYDYIAENLSDLMSLVPRAMAIGCFLTVKPTWASALGFFSMHFLVTFLWFWRSAPKRIPGYRSTNRDFRGQRRDRHDYMDHIQASVATLLFPPTHRAWPENFASYKDRLRGVATKQFSVVTGFQFVETLVLLALWTFLVEDHVYIVPTLIAVVSWSVARIICHIGYYVFFLFPFYIWEWDNCTRRRGLIAKMEILRMAEELGGYFCPKLRPKLQNIRDLTLSWISSGSPEKLQLLREECDRLVDHLLNEAVGTPKLQRTRTQKHRLQAMISVEKDLLRAAQREAVRFIRAIDSKNEIVELTPDVWENLVQQCVDLAAEWERILLLGLTHQRLPMAFLQAERDLGLAQYPEMFQKLVIRNDLLLRRRTSQTPIRDIKRPDTERALRETSTPL